MSSPADATNTAYLTELAAQAAGSYGYDPASVALVNLSENATFSMRRICGEVAILRVHRAGYNSEIEVRSELAWMQALRTDTAVRTPAVLESQHGAPVVAIRHPVLGDRLCVAFEFLSGSPPSEDNLTACFEMLGWISAEMHAHVEKWSAPAWFSRRQWDLATTIGVTPAWGDWRAAPDIDPSGKQIVDRACAAIVRALKHNRVPDFGLIHADMRLANVLVDGDAIAIIDFDDCGFSWHLWDLATALTFMEDDPRAGDLVDAWVGAYRRIRPLAAEALVCIPHLIMLRRILVLAWLGSHADSMTAREEGPGYTRATYELCDLYLSDPAKLF